MGIIDSHVHFWEPAALHYEWLADLPALQRAFLPADFAHASRHLGIDAVVAVEANCAPNENMREAEFFAAMPDTTVAGIVAFADLTQPSALDQALDQLSQNTRVRGIRQNIQGHPRGFCLQDSFVEGVRKIGLRGYTFDLCITHDQCGDALELVLRCPDTSFVLDHCGKPAVRGTSIDPWSTDVRRLGRQENVTCKLSGLLTEADLDAWRAEDILPYAARVAESFGASRLMYGSDWPVLTLAGSYRDWYDFTELFTSGWSDSERRAFYRDNAMRVYRL